jgi:hypothetical protein
MDKIIFQLKNYKQPFFTRPKAIQPHEDLEKLVAKVPSGSSIYVDLNGVEGVGYSYANELFGKTLISLKGSGWKKFLLVTNITDDCREDLVQALEALDLVILEKENSGYKLIGKVNSIDEQTFQAIAEKKAQVSSAELSEELKTTANAINERLAKLVEMGIVTKTMGISQAGREQYLYSAPR